MKTKPQKKQAGWINEDQRKVAERILLQADEKLYGEGRDKVLQMVQSQGDPAKGIGVAAAETFNGILSSVNASGKPLPTAVSRYVMKGLVEDISQLANAAGVVKAGGQAEANQIMAQALVEGTRHYMQRRSQPQGQAQPQGQQPPGGLLQRGGM